MADDTDDEGDPVRVLWTYHVCVLNGGDRVPTQEEAMAEAAAMFRFGEKITAAIDFRSPCGDLYLYMEHIDNYMEHIDNQDKDGTVVYVKIMDEKVSILPKFSRIKDMWVHPDSVWVHIDDEVTVRFEYRK